jgi:hypothetical protein
MTRRYTGGFLSATEQATDANTANGIYTISDAAGATAAGNFPTGRWTPQRSLRFRRSASAYLNRTPASASNRKTWTWSTWVKRGLVDQNATLFAARTSSGATYLTFVLSSLGDFRMESNSETAYPLYKTEALFRDPAAWYHIVVALDTTQVVSTNRLKVYVNGIQQITASYNIPAQNTDLAVNSTETHLIGQQASGNYADVYLTEVNLIDGQALTPSSFGQTDPETGTWVPKQYTGAYGTNGFYLPFNDNTTTATLGRNFAPGTQNLYTYSEQLDNAAWGKSAVTVTANAIANPIDGSVTAEKIVESATNASHALYRGVDTVAQVVGQSYTTSWYMKAAGRNIVRIYWWSVSGNGLNVYYNMSTGQATMTNNQNGGYWNATMQDVGSGWFRCSVTGVATSTGTDIYWGLYQTQGTDTYLGDGSSGVYMYGLQSEIGRTPTTYIATTSSYVTGDFTPNNISLTAGVTYDSMVDVPGIAAVSTQADIGGVVRGNYATFNPVAFGTGTPSSRATFSNANLYMTGVTNVQNIGISTIGLTSGKWYWETKLETVGNSSDDFSIGILDEIGYINNNNISGYKMANRSADWGWYSQINGNGTYNQVYSAFTWTAGDICGIAVDFDTNTVRGWRNNTLIFTSNIIGLAGKTWYPYVQNYSTSSRTPYNASVNFGQQPFTYTPPTGFKSLCTTNLPNPIIKRSEQHFDIKTYAGSGLPMEIGSNVKQSSAYPINRSIRLRTSGGSSQTNGHIRRFVPTAGNQQKYTFSTWYKGTQAVTATVFTSGSSLYSSDISVTTLRLRDTYSEFYTYTVSTDTFAHNIQVPWVPIPGKWYNIVVAVDTTLVSASSRIKIYVNGVLLSHQSGTTYPAQNYNTIVNKASSHFRIGHATSGTDEIQYNDAQYSETQLIDGQQLDVTTFGQFDANNNWVPKTAYTGSYGQNGFYLPYNQPNTTTASYAAKFNGSNYISLPSNSGYAFGTGDFTVEGWFYVTALNGGYSSFITTRGVSGTGLDIQQVSGQLMIGNPSGAIISATNVIPLNTWVHIAGTRASGTFYMFINGQLAASGASSQNFTDTAFYIGSGSGGNNNQWSGFASNVRVVKGQALYTAAFTPTGSPLTTTSQGATAGNVTLLTLQSATLVDNSSNNFTVTNSNSALPQVAYPFQYPNTLPANSTYAIQLKGVSTSQSITAAYSADWDLGNSDFTIEFFGRSADTAKQYPSPIGRWKGSGEACWDVRMASVDANYNFAFVYFSSGSTTIVNSGVKVTDGMWHHLAITRTGGNLRFFVDGKLVSTNSIGSATIFNNATVPLYIGDTPYGSAEGWYQGFLSNIHLVKGTALYTSSFTPPTSAITAVANTKLLTAKSATIVDVGPNAVTLTNNGSVASPVVAYPFQDGGPFYSAGFDGYNGYLTFPNSSAFAFGTGDYTIEGWINAPAGTNDKFILGGRAAIGASSNFLITTGGYTGSTTIGALRFYVSGAEISSGSTLIADGSWHHFAVTRTGTTARLFVDGILCGSGTDSGNYTTTTGTWYIARNDGGSGNFLPGYISNLRIIKGTNLYSANFVPPTSPLTAVSGTSILTCNTHAPFMDQSALSTRAVMTVNGNVWGTTYNPFTPKQIGYDSASNNHVGTSSIYPIDTQYDCLPDTPSDNVDGSGNIIGNYNCLNSYDVNGAVIYNGGLQLQSIGTAAWRSSRATMTMTTGKWYAEFTPISNTTSANCDVQVGILQENATLGGEFTSMQGIAYSSGDGTTYINGSSVGVLVASYTYGDIIGVAYNADTGEVSCYKNNTLQNTSYVSSLRNVGAVFGVSAYSRGGGTITVNTNFGQLPFAYAPPAGFKALNTKNAKDVGASNLPDSYGNFVNTPDLVWIKNRNTTLSHNVYDTVRGPTKRLQPNLTNAQSIVNGVTAFIPNGIEVGNATDDVNYTLNNTYAAWMWNRGVTPGFDIVQYAGRGAGTVINHNLGTQPAFVLIKRTDAVSNWIGYHKGSGVDKYFYMTSAAFGDQTAAWRPTANGFGISQSWTDASATAETFIAYMWAEVPGFSKFGSYTGNGAADGPFIYTGFRPKLIITKRTDSASSGDWNIVDSVRNTTNPVNKYMYLNATNAEGTATIYDFYSNGFKIRESGAGTNASGSPYIYIAFAESPFKYANAR